MLFAKKIIKLSISCTLLCFLTPTQAQINSPFSRYGLGNEVFNSQNAASQGMGGFTSAFTSGMNGNYGQSINFNNPASYGGIFLTTFDLGMNFSSYKLKRAIPAAMEKSNYLAPNYLAIGIPIDKKKRIGMAFGLRPISQIKYSVNEATTLKSTGDTVLNNYQGDGGLNQLFIGVGKSWKYISLGMNTGVNFGRKKIETRKSFLYNPDSTFFYQSISGTNTTYSGVFLNLGIQGEFPIKKVAHTNAVDNTEYTLSYGVMANLDQTLSAKQDIVRSTGNFTTTSDSPLDTASSKINIPGTIHLPGSLTMGIAIHKRETTPRGAYDQWVGGIEYTSAAWKDKYQFYGQKDALSNSWMMRMGLQYCPNPNNYENYWSTVTFRVGYFNGKDYANIDNNGLKVSGFTAGMGLPIRKYRAYDLQYTLINLTLQFGQRGSSANNFSEGFTQFTLGYSLSDIWFNKRRYD